MFSWLCKLLRCQGMTDQEKAILKDIRESMQHLAEVAKDAEQPVRAILTTQIFLIVQKVRYLEGER